jgi:hypothetical protein
MLTHQLTLVLHHASTVL